MLGKSRATPAYKNRVLAALGRSEINRLAPHLSPMTFSQNEPLAASGKKARYAYFVEEGMASTVITMRDGSTVEVGVVGREGVVGLPAILGVGSSPLRTFMQIAGHGFRIEAERLQKEFERSGRLRFLLQQFVQLQMVLMAQSAACNRLHAINERLARWILTCQDRVGTDCLLLKHEFLAQMLGTRRSSVTLAAGMLHRSGLIDYARGKVSIRNRAGLESAACECYRIVRNEAERLGAMERRNSSAPKHRIRSPRRSR